MTTGKPKPAGHSLPRAQRLGEDFGPPDPGEFAIKQSAPASTPKPKELSPAAGCGILVLGMVFLAILIVALNSGEPGPMPAPTFDPATQQAIDEYKALSPAAKAQIELEDQRYFDELVNRRREGR